MPLEKDIVLKLVEFRKPLNPKPNGLQVIKDQKHKLGHLVSQSRWLKGRVTHVGVFPDKPNQLHFFDNQGNCSRIVVQHQELTKTAYKEKNKSDELLDYVNWLLKILARKQFTLPNPK